MAEHHFEFKVRVRGDAANWWSDPMTLTVRAYSLNEALVKAVDVPLHEWGGFGDDDEPEPESFWRRRFLRALRALTDRY